ncbi:MAG: hypothetical protein ABII96_12015, partial [Candidatus Zixiibacteriota bacterium]
LLPLPSCVSESAKQINRVIPIFPFAVVSLGLSVSVLTAPVRLDLLMFDYKEARKPGEAVGNLGLRFGSLPKHTTLRGTFRCLLYDP